MKAGRRRRQRCFSINGGRTEYNNWELDGGDNMDNGSNSTLNVYPNLEAIAEFKVLTSNYGAQYGRNGSGTVEVETKSGTNTLPRQCFRIRPQRYFQRAEYFRRTSRASVQEERLRIHHRRSGLYSRPLQQGPEQDVLLLVAGMAPRPNIRQGSPATFPRRRTGRRFQRYLSWNDCPNVAIPACRFPEHSLRLIRMPKRSLPEIPEPTATRECNFPG